VLEEAVKILKKSNLFGKETHQDQFTRRPEAGRQGLVLIYPPAGEECTEAAKWMRGVPDLATHLGGASGQKAA
jgi:hypothetical protein